MARVGRESEHGDERDEVFSHPDPVVDEALEWLAVQQNTQLDAATRQRFEAWLARSPRHAEEFRNVEAMWGSAPLRKAAAATPVGLRNSVGDRRQRWSRPPVSGWSRRSVAAAAILVIVAGAWQLPNLMLRWQADYVTATGDRAEISLPDGSTMLLNTASAVSVDFKNGRRQVTLLEGEAFFDVLHDPAHPFRVTGHFGEVQVKGTAFAVRSENKEDTVVLERGRVGVSRLTDKNDHVDLLPGETVAAMAAGFSPVAKRDPGELLAWRDGRIIFENQPFARVLDELRRYYKGTVIVVDSRVNNLAVTGNYRLDDVAGAIQTLADAAGVTMNRLPGGIIILR
jgi:transmembrane sensor